ncbi:MAG: NAD(P)-binding domain-containing protein [Aggregatilineales bacterium]
MKIGIIGTSRIGGTLGRVWASAGHDVMFGVRDTSRVYELPGTIGTVAEAAQHGEAILFALPGKVLLEVTEPLDLTHKIVIDATNGGDVPQQPVVQALAGLKPNAFVYKAFNTLGFENFQNPTFGDERGDMLFIGHEEQQESVAELIHDVGLNPLYMGDLTQTGVLDAALSLWFGLSRRLGRHLAFRILYTS